MVQTIFMTDEEKRTMYAKLSKKDVIELLIEAKSTWKDYCLLCIIHILFQGQATLLQGNLK